MVRNENLKKNINIKTCEKFHKETQRAKFWKGKKKWIKSKMKKEPMVLKKIENKIS